MSHSTSIICLLSFVISAFSLKYLESNRNELPDTLLWHPLMFMIEVTIYPEGSSHNQIAFTEHIYHMNTEWEKKIFLQIVNK